MIQMELLKLSAALAGHGRPKLVFMAYVDDARKRRAGLRGNLISLQRIEHRTVNPKGGGLGHLAHPAFIAFAPGNRG